MGIDVGIDVGSARWVPLARSWVLLGPGSFWVLGPPGSWVTKPPHPRPTIRLMEKYIPTRRGHRHVDKSENEGIHMKTKRMRAVMMMTRMMRVMVMATWRDGDDDAYYSKATYPHTIAI